MVTHMKAVAAANAEFSVDERNLISVAYKNVIGSRRGAWRVLSSIKDKEVRGSARRVAACTWCSLGPRQAETPMRRWGAPRQESKGDERHVTLVASLRTKIEKELSDICADVISLLSSSLIPKASAAESKVFFHKMYAVALCAVGCPRPGR